MNKQEMDVLNALQIETYVNQRLLAESCGHSLGVVNRSIKDLICKGYLDDEIQLTAKAIDLFREKTPKNAVILAAGFGMRMVPINMETPKGLLEVHGEPLIERLIKQLHEVDIHEIYVVVGFMKEQYEYLIDKYNVQLIVNSQYAVKNNLHSMRLVTEYLSNSYIIPCDVWCRINPFHQHELYSWYMVCDQKSSDSSVRVNRKNELVVVPNSVAGNSMIGICYLTEEQSVGVRKRISDLCLDSGNNSAFWEEALLCDNHFVVYANVMDSSDVVEINTYEQLRDLDGNSNQLKAESIQIISNALHADINEIVDITVLKKGMTNRSFLFNCRDKRYIMRIPGEGTTQLINRKEEASVYRAICGKGISDDLVYINPENGYKITRYLEESRVCNPLNSEDVKRCMQKLRMFHEMNLCVEHEFNLFEQILFYESLRNGTPSVYKDYENTKKDIFSLQSYIHEHVDRKCLTHIDAVPDNFLFAKNSEGKEELRIIDWEYAGMQDPHVDIAMFAIYALYDRAQIDDLIDMYFVEGCKKDVRIKVYCYIAVCGLLWSNWCEYKSSLGIEFGEYSLKQYRYAKEYFRIVHEELS